MCGVASERTKPAVAQTDFGPLGRDRRETLERVPWGWEGKEEVLVKGVGDGMTVWDETNCHTWS